MKVKIKDGGIYRTVEIEGSDYGIYLKKGYTKVIEEPAKVEKPVEVEPVKVEPVIEEKVEEKITVDELPKLKKKKK